MKAIVLLSGGLDSMVALGIAVKKKRDCLCISIDYGQRHIIELTAARKIAEFFRVPHKIFKVDPQTFSDSVLIGNGGKVPKNRSQQEMIEGGIPSTYVPARNTLFLAYALGQAEIWNAKEIYVGFNALDAYGYPDCRPAFVQAFQNLINVATKQSVTGQPPQLIVPLIEWDKHEIVRQGRLLNLPLKMSFSCYDPTQEGNACLECDACRLRQAALKEDEGIRKG